MKNMGDLQKMAREMQANMAKAQEELAAATVEGSAGGGAVVVVLSGTQDVKSIKIQKDAVDPDDVETLQDLVLAAFSDALKKSRDLAAQRLGGVTGGLKIPSHRRALEATRCRPQDRAAARLSHPADADAGR